MNDRLVWIDCEMTGLDLEVDELVEIAVIITDYDLNPVDGGLSIVIKPDASALENMGEFVRAMHTESGLIEEIPNGVSAAEAEYEVIEYILKHVPEEQKAPLAGNSIGTDRSFLAKYMPRLDGHLHYRNVDVSSIKEFAKRWYPRAYFATPEKNGSSVIEGEFWITPPVVVVPKPVLKPKVALHWLSVLDTTASCLTYRCWWSQARGASIWTMC